MTEGQLALLVALESVWFTHDSIVVGAVGVVVGVVGAGGAGGASVQPISTSFRNLGQSVRPTMRTRLSWSIRSTHDENSSDH